MFIHFLLAMLPIIWLIIALSGLKMAGHVACPIALIITAVEALFLWKQKIIDVLTGGLEGFAMAIWPICLVIVAAVFTYNLVVHTKNMELIKKMLTSVSKDKRILVLIISWGFGGFMEGMAGFGTAVAIPAGILCGLGFDPIFAAMVCLVANTTPVAFGSIGIPTVTAANVTGFSPHMTASYVVLQLALMVILVPFFLVFITGKHEGAKGLGDYKEILFITLMSGVSFLIPQYLTAKFIGAELPAVIGSVCSMAVTIILAKVMLKGKSSKFDVEIEEKEDERSLTVKDALVAWSPFILVLVFLLLTSTLVPAIHDPLSAIKSSVPIYMGCNTRSLDPYSSIYRRNHSEMSDRRNLWCIRKNYRTDVKNNYYDHGSTCNCKDHGIQRNDTVYCRFYRSSNRKFLSTCCTTDRIYWNICYRKFYIKQCSVL